MKKKVNVIIGALGLALFMGVFGKVAAQDQTKLSNIFFYKKQEQNLGIKYYSKEMREELISPDSRSFEELSQSSATFQFTNRIWNYLDYKQEKFEFNAEIGPVWGSGNFIDSSFYEYIVADENIAGITAQAEVCYVNRYYWDRKNYTIVDVSAWGRYNWYSQNSKGVIQDSNRVSTPYDISENQKKYRYGFQAKAGWGIGRLNPMNNYMMADFLLNKYFAGRNFSEEEIIKFADEIARIKAGRNVKIQHDIADEGSKINAFISQEFLLTQLPDLQNTFGFGEFLPRLDGARIEAGPFFKYFNREPDFIYGGYLNYVNEKYRNPKWNHKLSAGIQYNRYKKQDWLLAEFELGASFYKGIRSRFDAGIKYLPGIVVNNFEDIEPVIHNFIPYLSYFTQINSKVRIEADALFRMNNNEKFITAGPEFSLKLYRSKY